MKHRLCMLSIALVIFFTACSGEDQRAVQPPDAKMIEEQLTMHGHTRIDPYFWLRERDNIEVKNYLNAENDYFQAIMADTKDLQETLFQEIKGRVKEDDSSVPYLLNGYWYYTRYEEGDQYPIYCRKEGTLDADEQVMLNVNVLAEGESFFSVRGVQVSPENDILSYGYDNVGRRKYTLRFHNLLTGEVLEDEIADVTGNHAWANDNKTIFYSRQDPDTLRSYQIYRYEVGSGNDPELVYQEDDDTFSAYVSKTKSQRYIIIGLSQTLSNEYHILDANNPDGDFRLFHPRERDLEYSIDHRGDSFYILTNNQAQNFRLMSTPVDATGFENWQEVIAAREEVFLQGFEVFEDYLVLTERSNGLRQIRVMDWNGTKDEYISFDDPVYVVSVSTNPRYDADTVRYTYASLNTPTTTYEQNMVSGKREMLDQDEVLGDFQSSDYTVERLWVTARDGKEIPMSVVYRTDAFKNDGSNPLLLYGYGSYGATMEPYFRSSVISLLDRSFVYAIAHIRGSQALGREWYEDGKLLNKINTFTDFIDCARYLDEQKYTSNEKLFAMGGSAGGLLMGAVINMAPEAFRGVIAHVPWVDVVTTMLDDSIPLTTSEYDEWGDPNVKEYYDYMLSYSPYDNVTAQEYPAIMVTTGFHDSQVQYWEPAKWVAKLRDMKKDDNLLIFHTNMEAGHGGASGRYEAYRETARDYAFILKVLGKTETE